MSLGIERYKLGINTLWGVGRHAGSQSCDAPCLVTGTRASDLSVEVAVNAALWPHLTPGVPRGPGGGAEAGQRSAEGKTMVPSQSGGPCRASLCLRKAEKAGGSHSPRTHGSQLLVIAPREGGPQAPASATTT